jgi:hypothetical protein
MLKAKLIFVASIFIFGQNIFARSPTSGNIWLSAGPYVYRTLTTHPFDDQDSPYLLGGGLIAQGDVDQNGGVEIAIFYLDKYYLRTEGEYFVIEKLKRVYITTGYRHWFNKYFSAGAAFFSSYSTGDPRTIQSNGKKPLTSARRITEYGLDFSVEWEIWGDEKLALIADARYSWVLTKKPHEEADVYGAYLGINYLIPKKS